MHREAFAADDADTAGALLSEWTATAAFAMASGDDISGAPLQARQNTAYATARRGGVVLPDNDNVPGQGHRADRDRLGRHEGDAAIHLADHPQEQREALAVDEQRQQLGVLGIGLQVLRGVLQIEGALRHLGRRAGIGLLTAFDLDGETRRLDRERTRSAATGAAEGEKMLGVGHGGLRAGDRHRGRSPDAGGGQG